jgi:hypothetical protein
MLAVALMVAFLIFAIPMASAQGIDGGVRDVLLVKVYFSVDGMGYFTANNLSTASGATCAWFSPGQGISLHAYAAPGYEFSHWTFNGNYAGSSPNASAHASAGLSIQAHFIKK